MKWRKENDADKDRGDAPLIMYPVVQKSNNN